MDNIDFREQLRALEPEAIGGEMEGGGLYVACQDRKVDWILVKAICDFADGHKAKEKSERQTLAARNAATLIHHAIRFVEIDWDAHHNYTMGPDASRKHDKAKGVGTDFRGTDEASGSHLVVHSTLMEKQITAMERLWTAVLALRSAAPAALFHVDYLTKEEYGPCIASAKGRELLRDLTEAGIAKNILQSKDTNIEDVRPVIGESLWKSFSSYRAFLARACLVTIGKFGDGGPWYEDDLALRLLTEALSPRDVAVMRGMTILKFGYVRERFEDCILARIGPVLSGSVGRDFETAGRRTDVNGSVRDVATDTQRAEVAEVVSASADGVPAAVAVLSLACGDTHSLHRQHQDASQTADFDLLVGLLSASPSRARQCEVSFDAGTTWHALVLRIASTTQICWKGYNARASATARLAVLVRTQGKAMTITMSPKIDAPNCAACAKRRPWPATLAAIDAKLRAHDVTWPNFVVMHGRDKTCAEALAGSADHDIGLYVVATDASGQEARDAHVFARKDGYYVGVRAILEGNAFG